MAIQTTGPISIQDIVNEFGGTAPHSLSEYYAGGPFVPSGTSGVSGAIPTTGLISLSLFYGASNYIGRLYRWGTGYSTAAFPTPRVPTLVAQYTPFTPDGWSMYMASSNSYGAISFYQTARRSRGIIIKNNGKMYGIGIGALSNFANTNTAGVRRSAVQIGTATDWSNLNNKVSAGFYHAHAIKTNGTLWWWGQGFGTGTGNANLSASSPTQLGTANNWKYVFANRSSSFFIKTNNRLYATGLNNNGQLGIGNRTNQQSIIPVGNLTNWKKISSSGDRTLALKTDGTIWAWGFNSEGQLGIGGTGQIVTSPIQIGTANNWVDIAGDIRTSFAVNSSGTLFTWGSNFFNGSVYTGNNNGITLTPEPVSTANWVKVNCNLTVRSALKSDGTLWTWGEDAKYFYYPQYNFFGRLGQGNVFSLLTPTQVGTLNTWVDISMSTGSSYAVTSS